MLLYSAEQSHQIDRQAIASGISGFTLMRQAANFAVNCLLEKFPNVEKVAVVAGAGNNGGDGLVMAALLKQKDIAVDVFCISSVAKYQHEAAEAYQFMLSMGVNAQQFNVKAHQNYDVIVDAVLGTGQKSPLKKPILEAINWINSAKAKCLAVDLPTGLEANTGLILEQAVNADVTATFITQKLGQYIGDGPAYCGERLFTDLELPQGLYQPHQGVELLDFAVLKKSLKPRRVNSHKGSFGHVLIVGGEEGYGGAAILAAVAAIRLGAGKVTLATKACHVMPALNSQPEIMVKAVLKLAELEPLLAQASVIVIGPGLGQEDWGKELLAIVLKSGLPKVIDADALNLIAESSEAPDLSNAVLTPHPGEAARLLQGDALSIQQNRLQSVIALQQKYNSTVLLKGAGSLVADSEHVAVCPYGNAHMASGGMGDVLSGIIAALMAQGLNLLEALELAVVLHAKAGDLVASEEGGLGLVASDILTYARRLMNDKV